ncbi:MAG: InlB B-repeat-containing protein, partial [Dehalococcoidia bacterium]
MKARSGLSRGGKAKTLTIVLVMTALVAALAGCIAIEYDVTFSSTDGGRVTAPGEGTFTYVFCTEVSLVATPDDGYRFVGWTGDVQAVVDVGSPSTIITSVQGDYAIRANFEPIPAGKFGLTTSSTAGGSVTVPGEGTFLYDEGMMVDLVAVPDSGYRFVNWTGDVGSVADVDLAVTTITMEGNYSIRANFEPIPAGKFGLTTSSTAGGSVTVPGEGTFLYDEGTVVDLVAVPDSGYRFVGWTGDVDSIADAGLPSTTIIMDGNYSVKANFEQIPAGKLALTTSSTAGGSVTVPGEGTFLYDEGM